MSEIAMEIQAQLTAHAERLRILEENTLRNREQLTAMANRLGSMGLLQNSKVPALLKPKDES